MGSCRKKILIDSSLCPSVILIYWFTNCQGSNRKREGRTILLEELSANGIEASFNNNDDNNVVVSFPRLGWDLKHIEILELNRPKNVY